MENVIRLIFTPILMPPNFIYFLAKIYFKSALESFVVASELLKIALKRFTCFNIDYFLGCSKKFKLATPWYFQKSPLIVSVWNMQSVVGNCNFFSSYKDGSISRKGGAELDLEPAVFSSKLPTFWHIPEIILIVTGCLICRFTYYLENRMFSRFSLKLEDFWEKGSKCACEPIFRRKQQKSDTPDNSSPETSFIILTEK